MVSARYRRAVHETKEHIGGFWVLEAADLNEALASRRKVAVASRASVEVRPIN